MARRQITLLFILLLSFALLGCGANNEKGNTSEKGSTNAGGVAYDFAPVKEAGYYSDLRVMPNGEFLVRGKLKDEDANKGGIVYKVEMNDNKQISKITSMDSGTPINTRWSDTLNNRFIGFAMVILEYHEGYVKYNFKRYDFSTCSGMYSAYSIRYNYDEKKNKPMIAYLYNKNGEQRDDKKGFAQMLFTYDEKGNLVKVGYSNKSGERIITHEKRYETRLKYDTDGKALLPIEVANYSKDGSLMADVTGIAKTSYVYDSKGRLIEVRHFGIDEKLKIRDSQKVSGFDICVNPIFLEYGAIAKYVYSDNEDKPTKVIFYGKDEQLVALNEEYPCASMVYTYTREGRFETVSLFGTDDLPCTKKNSNTTKIKYNYDDYGNLESRIYYGKDNNLVLFAKDSKAAITRWKYNDKRKTIEISYWGTDGEPVQIQQGSKTYRVHRVVYEYGDGHEMAYYYNKDGKKVHEEKNNSEEKK